MTVKSNESDDETVHPHYVYRKMSKVARRMIGLGPTQTNQAIRDGTIPPPVNLSGNGRAQGWTGAQLIEMQRQRLARAEAEQRARMGKKANV
jgi:hypothetical protein